MEIVLFLKLLMESTITFCNEIWATIFNYLDLKTMYKLESIPFFQYLLNLNIREINNIYDNHLLEKIEYYPYENTDDYILDNLSYEHIKEHLINKQCNNKYMKDIDTITHFDHDFIRSHSLKILLS